MRKFLILIFVINNAINASNVKDNVFYSPKERKCYELFSDLTLVEVKCPKTKKERELMPKIRFVRS